VNDICLNDLTVRLRSNSNTMTLNQSLSSPNVLVFSSQPMAESIANSEVVVIGSENNLKKEDVDVRLGLIE
jgi:hypothetical protein